MKLGYELKIGNNICKGFFAEKEKISSNKDTLSKYMLTAAPIEMPGVLLNLICEEDLQTKVCSYHLDVKNNTGNDITLHAAHIVFSLDFPYGRLHHFTSDWGSEYSSVEQDITYDIQIATRSGRSSKGCCPYFYVSALGENIKHLGVSVAWSGNWQANFKRLIDENIVTVGMLEENFFHTIHNNETFENIEICACYLEKGDEEDLSYSMRTYFKNNVRIFDGNMETLPVGYNDWWPYEDKWINEQVFFDNAVKAKEIGCTHTLLDAGWFGPSELPDPDKGMPWYLKRGDWHMENKILFPSGISELGKKVNNKANIPFGIWCEIEAVGVEAELNKTHPQLIANRKGESLNYVCMGNPETVEWALGIVEKLIEDYGAKWLKFDFNLDPGYGCDCEEHGHGKGDGVYAHYKGYYNFLDRIREKYPDVILENCASGGLRIDYGIMRHCHLLFLSDPDYTRHHLQCFWGALSHIHPSVCYHFTQSDTVCQHNAKWDSEGNSTFVYTPITEHTTLTELDYMTRACMTGILGFSQKLTELPEWAMKRLSQHIAFYKQISKDYILNGDIHRLTGQTASVPGRGESWCAFQLNKNNVNAILFVYKSDDIQPSTKIKLKAIDKNALYELYFHSNNKRILKTGTELLEQGIKFNTTHSQWSDIIEIKAI